MWLFGNKGSSGFSYSSTAEDVTQGIDGSGLIAIVTGASSGIGTETARVLALRGVHVIMGVRNVAAGKEVKEAIVKEIPAAKIDAMELDLSSMASVRKFATEFTSLGLPLNLLMNNGNSLHAFDRQHRITVCHKPHRHHVIGVQMPTFWSINLKNRFNRIVVDDAVVDYNSISGHFLLTNLLLDTMKKTSSETKKEGRIVNVSSRAHKFSYHEGIRFDKINDQAGYSSGSAYGQSKLANILHANELARRLKEDGAEITANSLHPGVITTKLFRHQSLVDGLVNNLGRYVLKNVQQGAATTCYVALHPQVNRVSGEYFVDNNLAKTSEHAANVKLARKLWDFSMDLVKYNVPQFQEK